MATMYPRTSGYSAAEHMSYGNVPYPRACGGCGAPSPCDGFIGSYVPPKYLARPCNPTYCSGYPDGAGACFSKKAPYPQGVMAGVYSQEGPRGDPSACDRGVDSRQLFEGNACMDGGGCDGFDDVYVDFCRDVAYADTLHADHTNVLTTTFNQVRDVRGPIDCMNPSAAGCPNHQFEGLYGRESCDPEKSWMGVQMGTSNHHCVEGNAPVRTFTY